ncbi:MAG TPA: leucyl/phenylalanyl-tRNA--protein transferase [Bacteriovoracaceae bacterium]|nr:leucyl/phenylalanyl-tRNA--protein transferase [Bacteriovoracaceae bacterium]
MKRQVVFPPVENATEDGLVAVGGDLALDTIEAAYRLGIFPWPVSVEFPLAWFSPDPRGVLDFEDLHVSHSFEKFLRKHSYRVTFNTAFPAVIKACARMRRKGQRDTWITPQIIKGYEDLFLNEQAYSSEVWNGEELVGGVYGVVMGEFVSGESMFMKEDNASKLALYTLIQKLRKNGIKWLDTQMVTPVVEQFGGRYIPRQEFLSRITKLDWDKKRDQIVG